MTCVNVWNISRFWLLAARGGRAEEALGAIGSWSIQFRAVASTLCGILSWLPFHPGSRAKPTDLLLVGKSLPVSDPIGGSGKATSVDTNHTGSGATNSSRGPLENI